MSFGEAFGPFGGAPDDDPRPGHGAHVRRGAATASPRSPGRRRPPAAVVVLVALVAAAGLLALLADLYTDVLWFSQLGFAEVLWTELGTRAAIFAVAGLLMAGVTALAMRLAWRARPGDAPAHTREDLGRAQVRLRSSERLVFAGVPAALGILAGARAAGAWQTVLLFLHQQPYGTADPEFGLDLMFFLATLPFLRLVVGLLSAVVLAAGLAGLAVHHVGGGLRLTDGGRLRLTRAARIHVGVTAGALVALQAATLWLQRYGVTQSQAGPWAGAMHTDVNAVIPTSAILAATAALVAVLYVRAGLTGRWRLPLVGTAVLMITSLLVGSVYPALIQRYQVKPSERTLEAPYIARTIAMTREAYGLDAVEVTPYAGSTDAAAGALAGEQATTASVRLMDPDHLAQTFGQLQQFRPYYAFPATLHVDRYTVDGQRRDVVLAARDVNVDESQSWVNRHAVYTHGYGLVAADAAQVGGGGRPQFLLSEIPSRGPLGDDGSYEPRIYFGLNSPSYSVVGAPAGAPAVERDRPQTADSGEDTAYTFTGDGGPSVGGLLNRLAYAVKFGSSELLLSSDVNEASQILYDRHPVDRVRKAAPFLTVDTSPYPAIVDGRVQWIVDAYTSSDQFPYSTAQQLGDATRDSRTDERGRALDGRVNYLRNAVKATVDAYDGSVRLYAWDDEDPLLRAWQRAYPHALRPYSEMSAQLLDHVRYPEDLFKVQRELLTRFHVTDPGDFYEDNDAWAVPTDPTVADQEVKQPPYAMTLRMPGDDTASFSLTSAFVPKAAANGQQRDVLYGFLAASGDAGTGRDGEKAPGYGRLRLLELPRQTTVPGPGQAQATFDSDARVSQELNLLRQGASDVVNGNLLTLPVAGGVLYVQPVYVKSSGSTSYPTLRKVLVSFGDRVGFADTLPAALDQVFGGSSGASTAPAPAPAPDAPGQRPPGEELSAALAEAKDAIAKGQEALTQGDWNAYGEQQRRLSEALARATAADDAAKRAPAP